MLTDQQLREFANKIRAKDDWETKILDKGKGLGVKWAKEAQLLTNGLFSKEERDDGERRVHYTLQELEAEAQRIIFHDHTLQPITFPKPQCQPYDFAALHVDTLKSYKFLKMSKYGISPPDLRTNVGVFVCDDMVPASVHCVLEKELSYIARREPRDFHPGTDGKVQDIIHPSLYPYKLNSTPLNSGTSKHGQIDDTRFLSTMHTENESFTFSSPFAWIPSIFRISPDGTSAEIQSYINGLGSRELHPELYKVIEEVFVAVMPLLEKTVNFNFVYKNTASEKRWIQRRNLKHDVYNPRILRPKWDALARSQEAEKIQEEEDKKLEKSERLKKMNEDRAKFEDYADLDIQKDGLTSSFAGRDLKVIVKAADYILNPGESYEGSWHIEGMPHEHIVASAIYYYSTDEVIIDQGLKLRYLRDEYEDFPQIEEYGHDDFYYKLVDRTSDSKDVDDAYGDEVDKDYPSDWEPEWTSDTFPPYINLGAVPTTSIPASQTKAPATGRILTFPNWVQHQVAGIQNSATTGEAARRKILCFFLVDDDHSQSPVGYDENIRITRHGFLYSLKSHTVLTTSDIPSQARGCNFPTLHAVLPLISKRLIGKTLPPELVELIIDLGDDKQYPGRGGALGIGRKIAEQLRREFMDDRRANNENGWESINDYSLCEH